MLSLTILNELAYLSLSFLFNYRHRHRHNISKEGKKLHHLGQNCSPLRCRRRRLIDENKASLREHEQRQLPSQRSLTARPHSGIDTRKAINQRSSPGNQPLGQQLLGLELIWSIVLETIICASGLESYILWKAITQTSDTAQEEFFSLEVPAHTISDVSLLFSYSKQGHVDLSTRKHSPFQAKE